MSFKFKHSMILLSIFIFLALVGCQERGKQASDKSRGESDRVTVKDDAGRKVTVKQPVRRIVSLSPSNTEILFSLDLDDRVVGVDGFSDYPNEAKKKEKIGGFANPNIEKITGLRPDLVLASSSEQTKVVKELERLKIKVFYIDSKNIGDVLDIIDKVGMVTGRPAQAKKVVAGMKDKIDEVRRRVRDIEGNERPKVFFELYNEPLMSAGPGTFIHDMISQAGGRSIAGSSNELYPQFSLETLIDEDPSVYLAGSGSMTDPGDVNNRPGWENLTAVKENNVFVLDEDLITRPGPRIVDGLYEMARAIHPKIFKK